MPTRELFAGPRLDVTLRRLAHQIIERHQQFDDLCMIGIQPRGVFLGRRLHQLLDEILPQNDLPYGELDVTFHRDDFRRRDRPITPNETKIDFVVEDKTVLLVDDVLCTGRTIRAAMDALLAFGRPRHIELLVLVDRMRQRDVPVSADYVGQAIETVESENVIVDWHAEGKATVRIER
ncbi:MAG: bifunctional pyr operon transcriptional regulator/uracil phosphoribosyltransferase PyrR [Bacteroidota bacterium]